MFSNEFPGLPRDLILEILNKLPLKDAISFLTVSKEMHGFIKEDRVWKKFGATDFTDFATRISALPVLFQQLVIYGKSNLETCERITREIYDNRNSDPTPTQALKSLLPPEYSKHYFNNPYKIFKILMPKYKDVISGNLDAEGMNRMQERSVAIGFLEELLTPEQMAKFKGYAIIELFSQNGIEALKNNLITPEEAASMDEVQLGKTIDKLVSEFEANKDKVEPSQRKPGT